MWSRRAQGRHPLLVWNTSAGVPLGLYRLIPTANPAVPDLVAVLPPKPLAGQLAEADFLIVAYPNSSPVSCSFAVASHGAIIEIPSRVVCIGSGVMLGVCYRPTALTAFRAAGRS